MKNYFLELLSKITKQDCKVHKNNFIFDVLF